MQSSLTEFGSPARYNLAVVYNDLGLVKETEGKAKEAQEFFHQAYTFLIDCPQCTNNYKSIVLRNLAAAALKAGDYRSALQFQIRSMTN